MSGIQDHMIYIIVCASKDGPYTPERYVEDMDRKTTVEHIATGQVENVIQVGEFNLIEGTSRDVTEDIAWEISHRWDDDGEPLANWQFEFIENHLGFEAANCFRRAA